MAQMAENDPTCMTKFENTYVFSNFVIRIVEPMKNVKSYCY